jgi:hypothetical protein
MTRRRDTGSLEVPVNNGSNITLAGKWSHRRPVAQEYIGNFQRWPPMEHIVSKSNSHLLGQRQNPFSPSFGARKVYLARTPHDMAKF